jgi:threonine dehydratase
MFDLKDLYRAQKLVAEAIMPTPQICWPLLSERAGAEVWVKHENHLPTGAFKVRGGLTYVERCRRERPSVKGVICATRGNHGQSLAFAGRRYDLPVTIVAPLGNSTEKNAAMRALGATLIEHGEDFEAARIEAERLSVSGSLEMVPSFHRDLVIGVATYALEFFTAAPKLDTVYVPIGLGSGICGCILARDLLGLSTEIVGVQASGAASYALSLNAGRTMTTERADTFADGVATRMPVSAAFEIIRNGAARIVTVDDSEIAAAVRAYWTDTHNLAEGAGAVALAALLLEGDRAVGRRIGLVLSGGNIDLETFAIQVMNPGSQIRPRSPVGPQSP